MNASYLRNVYLRLAGVVMLVVMAALTANAFLSHRNFERALAPEVAKKVVAGGESIRVLILKAVANRIDFRGLYGVDQKFDEIKSEMPEITYFAVTDEAGGILYQRLNAPTGAVAHFRTPGVLDALRQPQAVPVPARVGNQYIVSLPIVAAQGPLGMLHLGVDIRFVDDIVLEMLYDVLVVLVVSLFFTLELLHFMAGAKLEQSLKALGDLFARGAAGQFASSPRRIGEQAFASVTQALEGTLERVNAAFEHLTRDIDAARKVPAHERPPGLSTAQAGMVRLSQQFGFGRNDSPVRSDDDQLPKIRAPLFMFILAEELTRSFLPTYVKSLLVPIPWLSPQLLVGLPIALFMLIVALAQPYFGVLCDRIGHRRLMNWGAGIAALGFLATAMASSVIDLLIWRSMCAVGYAMVFVAGQAYVLEHSTLYNRAKSFALFVGAIMVATVCGPSIGGILADNIGERLTFGVAALLALASLATIRLLPEPRTADGAKSRSRAPTLAEIATLMTNRRFMTVTGLAAMPAKILLTGVLFYLVPLYVLQIGSTQAMAGRVLMAYAVMMVALGPLTAGWATTRERMEWLVGGGLVVSGIGGAALLLGSGVGWVFAAVVLVGIGQAMSISAQSALVSEHCESEIAAIGEGAVFGVYRLLERLGNAAGPLIAAGLVMSLGYRTSFVAIGGFVAVCGLLFMLMPRRQGPALLVAPPTTQMEGVKP